MSAQRERRTCTQEYQQGFYSPKASLGELTTSEYGKKSISICSAPSIVASEAFEHFDTFCMSGVSAEWKDCAI